MSTEVQEAGPRVLEFGRYKLMQAPDGAWWVYRAVETCERCQSCGCGAKAEPIEIPAWAIAMGRSGGISTGMLNKIKGMFGFGRDGNGDGPRAA